MRHFFLGFLIFLLVDSKAISNAEPLPVSFPKGLFSYSEVENSCIDQFSILTFNTWGLPVRLPGHDQASRFPKIPAAIQSANAAIVCLQETFHPELRHQIAAQLFDDYPFHTEHQCQKSILPFLAKDCYGGLLTLSKFPIISEKFYPFPVNDEYSLIERIGNKGFLLTTLSVNHTRIHVVNTHLYAGHSPLAELHRKDQIEYMHQILQTLGQNNEPVFLAGDINVHHPCTAFSNVYEALTNDMLWQDVQPIIDETHFTSDKVTNKYVSHQEPRAKLDYIFFQAPDVFSVQVLSSQKWVDQYPHLSDHFGWLATFQIKGRELTQPLYTVATAKHLAKSYFFNLLVK